MAPDLDAIVGCPCRLSYYDHNKAFEALLPRCATISSRFVTRDFDDWYLLELDNSLVYEGISYSYLAIRSKWHGRRIERDNECAVFILLVRDPRDIAKQPVDTSKLPHVAWGFVRIVEQ